MSKDLIEKICQQQTEIDALKRGIEHRTEQVAELRKGLFKLQGEIELLIAAAVARALTTERNELIQHFRQREKEASQALATAGDMRDWDQCEINESTLATYRIVCAYIKNREAK